MSCAGLVLIGHPGCGKSYFAERFSTFWGISWVDTDQLVEELYFRETGKSHSCREIFCTIGEKAFRKKEQQVITHIPPCIPVIAAGGGTVLQDSAVDLLKKRGRIVFLALKEEAWKERISIIGLPLSFLDASPLELFYQERLWVYENVADTTLFLDGKSDQVVLQALAKMVGLL